MAGSFSEKERASIIAALRRAAGHHAAEKGMRKTTVDELVAEAGISKGAFYKFYPSKEFLFLDMLEQWHKEIEEQVTVQLAAHPELGAQKRAALMLKTALKGMCVQSLVPFSKRDLPYLLRKLPEAQLREHYQSNEQFVRQLMAQARVTLSVPEGEAYAAIRILIFSLLYAKQVGDEYTLAMGALIDGACERMIKNE